MLKTLVCQSETGTWILAVVRGDHELNPGKLRATLGENVALADENQADAAGFAIGFVGPHAATGRDDVKLVIDFDAAQKGFLVTGANQTDYHVRHFSWKRFLHDPRNVERSGRPFGLYQVADIRNAVDGDPAPAEFGGGTLRETKGIELGHIFKLGTKYATALDATVLDEQNQRQPILMGCYGIGINRILAAAIETDGGHDEHGIIWPAALAPYPVLLTPVKYAGQVKTTVDQLALQFEDRGLDVLVDDRNERPGVKFKDADLIGLPLRLTVGDRGLTDGVVELKARNGTMDEKVPVPAAAERAVEALAGL
jgi:prolyl-tRNA synthetase